MKKNSFFTIILTLTALATSAQTTIKLSLKQAQEFGLAHRYDVRANSVNLALAEKNVQRAKQARLPEVSANANVTYHPQLQATLIPPGFVGALTEPTLLALGAKSISIYSLDLKQSIYNPKTSSDIKLSTNEKELEQEKKRENDIQVKHQISRAYLNVQLKDLQRKIASEERKRYSAYLALAEGRFKNGALIENDYLRAKLDYENASHQNRISEQEYQLSNTTLKFELNIDTLSAIILTDSLDRGIPLLVPIEERSPTENRTEIKQILLQQKANELELVRQRRSVLPSISLSGSYAQQYLNSTFNFDYSNTKWWSPFSAIGLKVSIPISGHFTNKVSLQQIRLKSEQTNLLKSQQIAKINYEIRKSVADLRNASENLKSSKASLELAQKVYRNQKQQFELGAFSYDSLLNTERSMLSAERNYIQSAYDLLLANLQLDLAAGEL